MELDGESIEVTNVQRPKVMMKRVVEERVIDGKVDWRCSRSGHGRRALLCCPAGLLVGRPLRFGGIWEGRVLVWSMLV